MRTVVLLSVFALAALVPACSTSSTPLPKQTARAAADEPVPPAKATAADKPAPPAVDVSGIARLRPTFW